YMLGGRAAEEMVFHDPTTGASNDIEKATGLARAMVMQYGMSERIGAIRLGQPDGEVFLGRDMGHGRDFSEGVAEAVDEEVRKLIESAHQEAYDILLENRVVLDQLVVELLDRETLDRAEVAQIFTDLRKHSLRPIWLSSSERPVSPNGPVLSRKELADRDEPSPNGSNGSAGAGGHSVAPPEKQAAPPVDSEQE
ncbi:MAG: cell division protein FtsH, partial [Candidatus Nanopelagicales bacterium]